MKLSNSAPWDLLHGPRGRKHGSVAAAMAQKLEAPLGRRVPDRRMNDSLYRF